MSSDRAQALGIAPLAAHRRSGDVRAGAEVRADDAVEAVRRVAQKAGWDLKDVDLFELNEAFAVQAVAVLNELGIDPQKVKRERRRRRARPRDRLERRACVGRRCCMR